MNFTGTNGNDVLVGTTDADTFDMSQGGNDTVKGQGGNDTIAFGAAFTSADRIDGGNGSDTVSLDGDYAGDNALVFTGTTMRNVETLSLAGGHSYMITTDDANVAAGATLTIDASALAATDKLVFNGASETDGAFHVIGGTGDATLTGGAGNDILNGGEGNNVFNLAKGGNDSADGSGAASNLFVLGHTFTAADSLTGSGFGSKVNLSGNYAGSHAVLFGATTMQNIAEINLAAGHSYDLTMNAATVSGSLTVNAGKLGMGDVLHLNGSATNAGGYSVIGGAGDDVIVGGSFINKFNLSHGGDDTVTGGSVNDEFIMGSALTESDRLSGGGGNDIVELSGNYADLVIGAETLTGISHIQLGNGDFNITFGVNVDMVEMLISALGIKATGFSFDGSAETSGFFIVGATSGIDDLIGSQLGDTFDIFNPTGSRRGPTLNHDSIDGQNGDDQVSLQGDYSAGLVLNHARLASVEALSLVGGFDYSFTSADNLVTSGQAITIDSTQLFSTDVLSFDGSAETDGHFIFEAGGIDTLTGGSKADTFDLGAGSTVTINYSSVAQSSGANIDTISNLSTTSDTLHIAGEIPTFSIAGTQTVAKGSLDADLAAFASGHLGVHKYDVVTINDGSTASYNHHTFLVIDGDGKAGYTSGADYVIDITGFGGDPSQIHFA